MLFTSVEKLAETTDSGAGHESPSEVWDTGNLPATALV